MKHFFLFAAVLLMLVSCNSVPQREGVQFGAVQYGETNNFNETEAFTVSYTTTNGATGTLAGFLPYPMTKEDIERMEIGRISEDDINFDGIPDVQFFLGYENLYGNDTYEAFVWDKELGTFEYVENYSSIYAPEFDKENKTITSVHREWMDGIEYLDYQKYQWVNGVLTLTESWNDEIDTNEYMEEMEE